MLKAPFNFVPLNEEPYIPEWADLISQDMPFEDGLSGKVRLKIIAETPIFVSDKVQEDNNVPCEFCHILDSLGNKRYFIPGTSIKGMLRSVMEILSFGKMAQVQNQSFGIRDLSNGEDGLFYRSKVKVDKVHCGWLRMSEGEYFLDDCGLPWRISAEEIDRRFHIGLMEFITNKGNFQSDDNKTTKKKYALFEAHEDCSLLTTYFEQTNIPGINAGGRKFVRFGHGGMEGTIVFTGQPGARQKKFNERKKKDISSGKFFEFVFPEQPEQSDIPVPEQVFKEFESIHQNSDDYTKFRKAQLMRGKEIPVFFIYNEDGEVETMGLSYMYKFPAFNKVYNGIPLPLLSKNTRDLCECIFGFTDNTNSLKGRVQFSMASLCTEPSFMPDVKLALAKPHPSYYPLYLGKGQTWNTENIRLAGRKRYPVRPQDAILSNSGTDSMSRIIRPMNAGATFEGEVRFFNLRPVELGALLSAIDFCHHEECSHNIGQGKPLGYGRVKLTVADSSIESISQNKPCSKAQAEEAFVSEMEKHFPGWATSLQLKELFAMAKGIPADMASRFAYMTMSTTGEENEFKQGLKAYSQGEQLGSFTEILSGNVPHMKQQSNVSPDAKRVDIELQLAKAEEERKEKNYQSQMSAARKLLADERWDEAVSKAEEAVELFPERTEALDFIHEIQRSKDYTNLLAAAQEAFSNNRWDEVISKAEEAASFCKDDSEIRALIDSAKGKKLEAQTEFEKSSQPLSEVIKGKTSAGNLVGTTVKWLKVEGHLFGITEYDAFVDAAHLLSSGEQKKLKSKLTILVKLIDEEIAKKLSNDLSL